jgi:O-antigen ligase
MRSQVESNNARSLSPDIMVIVVGVLTAVILFIAAIQGKKWLMAASLGMISAFTVLLVTRNIKQALIILAVFALPIKLNYHLVFKVTPYSQLSGLPISLFDLVFAVLIVIWIYQIMLGQEQFNIFPAISFPALAYILLAGLSAFLSQDRMLSFFMLLLTIKSYVVFLYFANNVKTRNEILWIAGALCLCILLQSLIGGLQHVTGGTLGLELFGEGEKGFGTKIQGIKALSRVGGTIGAPNTLAMFLNFCLPVIFCLIFTDVAPKIKILASIIFLLGGLTELLTLSRGGWLGLSFGMVVCLYGIFKNRFKSSIKSIFVVSLSLLIAAVLIIGLFENVRSRLFEDDYGSAHSRIPMMKVAWNIIKDKPLTGIGLNNYTTVMNAYDRTRINISYKLPFPVHNSFLIVAAESGILALFFVCVFLWTTSFKALKFFQEKDRFLSILGIGWFAGLLTWMIHGQVRIDFLGLNAVLWFSIGMIAAIHRMLIKKNDEENHWDPARVNNSSKIF